MARCSPGHDAITGRPIKVTMTPDSLTLVAKKQGMTMYQYIHANPDTVFVVEHGWVEITYNSLPNGSIGYRLIPQVEDSQDTTS